MCTGLKCDEIQGTIVAGDRDRTVPGGRDLDTSIQYYSMLLQFPGYSCIRHGMDLALQDFQGCC